MPRHARKVGAEQPGPSRRDAAQPAGPAATNDEQTEEVTLGIGSRAPVVETGHEPAARPGSRGLLPVPPEVEAEVRRQEARQPMTAADRKKLRDRLTLGHDFGAEQVAFRRTPEGMEVLAAGLDEIAEFRRGTTPGRRAGVVYGVG